MKRFLSIIHKCLMNIFMAGSKPVALCTQDRFKRQFAHLEENYGKGEKSNPLQRHHASLPRKRVPAPKDDGASQDNVVSPNKSEENPNGILQNETGSPNIGAYGLLKSASISLFGLWFSVEEDLHHHRRREGGSGFNRPFRRHLRNRGRRH